MTAHRPRLRDLVKAARRVPMAGIQAWICVCAVKGTCCGHEW